MKEFNVASEFFYYIFNVNQFRKEQSEDQILNKLLNALKRKDQQLSEELKEPGNDKVGLNESIFRVPLQKLEFDISETKFAFSFSNNRNLEIGYFPGFDTLKKISFR